MSSDAPSQHRAYAPKSVGCAVLTVSDSRTVADDKSGQQIRTLLEAAGHRTVEHAIVPDDAEAIRFAVLRALGRDDVDAVIATGGTGVSPRSTPPAASPGASVPYSPCATRMPRASSCRTTLRQS